jgi:hypothetical protein
MTSNTKTTTPRKKKSTTASSRQATVRDAPSQTRFGKERRFVYLVGALVATCICIFAVNISLLKDITIPSPVYAVLWFPPLPMLLIALFGSGYIYKVLKGRSIGTLARMIVYMLLVAFAVFLLCGVLILGGKGSMCTGIMGAQADCSETNFVLLYILLGNPFSLMLLSALSITGSVALLVKPK